MKRYYKYAAYVVAMLVVTGGLAWFLAGKYDVLWFSMIHPDQVRFAKQKYTVLHNAADQQYYTVMGGVKK